MHEEESYLDVIKKMDFYKEKVLNELIEHNIYPSNEAINNRLTNINYYISLFKNNNIASGESFDTENYNENIKLIYKDICILYELLEEIQLKRFHQLQGFIISYISELSSIADTYKKRAELENSSTTLGQTILFKNNNFKINSTNSTTVIDLNNIEINEAESIICLANIDNIDADNLLFVFTDLNTDEEYKVAPYNYSNETLLMPGSKKKSNIEINMTEDQKLSTPLYLNLDKDIDIKNKYTIMGAKNKIFINYQDKNEFKIEDCPTTLGSKFYSENTYINFYVVGGNTATFKFNKKPKSSNFSVEDLVVNNLDEIHHFFIEADKDFTFEVELNKGTIYATKEEGIIYSNKLYYTGTTDIKDFNIIEEETGSTRKYHAELRIFNDNNSNYDIDSIVIKKVE